jgi:hypothetical protein
MCLAKYFISPSCMDHVNVPFPESLMYDLSALLNPKLNEVGMKMKIAISET